jgi:exopolyphosphatase/guanosine-5'-triphosphate,3'-diphosphate pyrophosphatase
VPTRQAERVARVAAIDCGTNSVRLLVADLDPVSGEQADVERLLRIVRLGAGVDAALRLRDDAVARLLAVCDEYAAVIVRRGADRIRFCATSAARDAGVTQPLRRAVRERLGVEVEVLTGEAEARLTAAGAVRGVRGLGLPLPHLVVDIGGGSTELAVCTETGVGAVHSLPVGSVRLTERLMLRQPDPEASQAVRAAVDAALRSARPATTEVASIVVVGGTGVTVAGLVLGVHRDDLARVHRAELSLADVLDACARLAAASVEERAAMECMLPGRADVIGAGALVLERVVQAVRLGLATDTLVVSTHDILDGIAWSAVA